MTSKRVFVAGRYRADNVLGILDNIREGLRWSTLVFLAGHSPFCPWLDFLFHLMLQGGEQLTVEQYQRRSMAWLEKSDVVLAITGWNTSEGAQNEMRAADKLGIPVVYRIEDI
jgi:hypothetical protein